MTAPVASASGVSFRRRNRVLAVSALLTLLSVVGVFQMRVHHDGLEWFPDDHPTRIAINRLEQSVGGTANVTLLIESKPGHSLRERESLQALSRLEQHIRDYTHANQATDVVRNTSSLMDVIRESWRAVHGGEAAQYRLPDTQRGIDDMLTVFENAGSEHIKRLATIDLRDALMTVRVQWLSATEYLPLVAHIERGVAALGHDAFDVETTGSVYLSVSVVVVLLDDLLRSFGTAALVITVLMVFVLKSLKFGLLAMLPNLLPVCVVMGFMGFSGIPLDTSTLMLGSVAIGIVVDDTIHFLHQFKAHYDEHGIVDSAVHHAFLHTGRAMFATSLILFAGLMCPLAAQLMSSKLFGILLAMTVVAALLLDFTFMPALLRVAFNDRVGTSLDAGNAPQPGALTQASTPSPPS